jgi:hypothetical protein
MQCIPYHTSLFAHNPINFCIPTLSHCISSNILMHTIPLSLHTVTLLLHTHKHQAQTSCLTNHCISAASNLPLVLLVLLMLRF